MNTTFLSVRRLLGSLGLGAALLAPASASWAGAIDQLQAFVSNTRAARGEFTQRQVRPGAQAGATAAGTFAFQRPGKFRWDVQKPFAQTIVADGQRLWMLDADLNQVTVRRISDAPAGTPAAILFGTEDIERSFSLQEAGTRDGMDWLEALPKNRDAGFERIAIGFRDGLPGAMEIRDAFGQTSLLAFRNIERNPRLAADAFRFDPPTGADVIEQ